MDEIKELDDKYLVLKWTDITEGLNDENTKVFADLVQKVDAYRRLVRERPVNKYVVLNLADELNVDDLICDIQSHKKDLKTPYIAINDIAVDIVNGIILAGNP